jgi:hypothetical protein
VTTDLDIRGGFGLRIDAYLTLLLAELSSHLGTAEAEER